MHVLYHSNSTMMVNGKPYLNDMAIFLKKSSFDINMAVIHMSRFNYEECKKVISFLSYLKTAL